MGIIEKNVAVRTYGTLKNYSGRRYNADGVARLLYENGQIRWEWSHCGDGFVTSPLVSLVIKDGKMEGVTGSGNSFLMEMSETVGIWDFPGAMIAIGYHTGNLYASTSEKIGGGATPVEVSLEMAVDPADNSKAQVVLNEGLAGVGQSYILTPEYLEYSRQVLGCVDGNTYEYYVLTIKTQNNSYKIALA